MVYIKRYKYNFNGHKYIQVDIKLLANNLSKYPMSILDQST